MVSQVTKKVQRALPLLCSSCIMGSFFCRAIDPLPALHWCCWCVPRDVSHNVMTGPAAMEALEGDVHMHMMHTVCLISVLLRQIGKVWINCWCCLWNRYIGPAQTAV
jgi:hypothetical protein